MVVSVSSAPGARVTSRRSKVGDLCSAAVVVRDLLSDWDPRNFKKPRLKSLHPQGGSSGVRCYHNLTMSKTFFRYLLW